MNTKSNTVKTYAHQRTIKALSMLLILFLSLALAIPDLAQPASALADPILDFDLTQGSGTTVVDSANGIIGTTHGTLWSTDPNGMPVLFFDNPIVYWFGDGDYFQIPHHAALNSPSISIEALIYPMSSGYYTNYVERIRDGETWQTSMSLGLASTGYTTGQCPRFQLMVNNVSQELNSPIEISYNAWSHIIGTYDGNDMRLYIDGILVATKLNVGGPRETGTNPLYLGHAPSSNHYFNGYYAHFKMYDRALTAEEIASQFNTPPTANAGGPYTAFEGDSILLDASSSTDPDNNITSYEWDLDNDGLYDDAVGVTTEYNFGGPGDYTVSLRVTDGYDQFDTDTAQVTIMPIHTPHVNVGRNTDFIHLYDWPMGATLTATFDNPANGPGIDFQITDIPVTQFAFNISFWDQYDVDVGHLVSISDGTTQIEHLVKDLEITSANPVTDIITGFAEPGIPVWVGSHSHPLTPQWVDPDPSSGYWEADFSTDDLKVGYWVVAHQHDEYGNSTQWDYGIPEISLAVDANSVSVNEGATALNGGAISHADGATVSLTSSEGVVTNNNDGTWSWSFTTSDGPTESQIITITADDGIGSTDNVSFDLIVNNVAPAIEGIDLPVDPVNINEQPVSGSVNFNDPGTTDTHDVTWDWGDGRSDTQYSVTSPAAYDHIYDVPGVYAVIVTVADDDGGYATAAFQYVVVYDPEGGFVTGGGWIWSPEGAYYADPSLTGKATFGFVSRYLRGANVPTGNTEFQFKVADLNFKSTSYDWLVIAGSKAQYKGTGTINGAGEYGFMLTATDGSPDKFRIKIWDKVTGEVIYDNQLGAADDANLTTALQGGSIVIHKTK